MCLWSLLRLSFVSFQQFHFGMLWYTFFFVFILKSGCLYFLTNLEFFQPLFLQIYTHTHTLFGGVSITVKYSNCTNGTSLFLISYEALLIFFYPRASVWMVLIAQSLVSLIFSSTVNCLHLFMRFIFKSQTPYFSLLEFLYALFYCFHFSLCSYFPLNPWIYL